MKKILLELKDYIIIVLAVLLIRTFIITPAIVDGDSMDNTLADGQLVIINKLVYKLSDIERLDIVVINNEQDNDRIIKRIIGLPEETIKYEDNKLYINGKELVTDIKFEYTNDFEVKTGKDEYFVLGDNRDISKDSRILGNFSKEDIVGRVTLRLFPFNKIGFVK